MRKSTESSVSTKTENATERGYLLTLTVIGIMNVLFADKERKTARAILPILTIALIAVRRWVVCKNELPTNIRPKSGM